MCLVSLSSSQTYMTRTTRAAFPSAPQLRASSAGTSNRRRHIAGAGTFLHFLTTTGTCLYFSLCRWTVCDAFIRKAGWVAPVSAFGSQPLPSPRGPQRVVHRSLSSGTFPSTFTIISMVPVTTRASAERRQAAGLGLKRRSHASNGVSSSNIELPLCSIRGGSEGKESGEHPLYSSAAAAGLDADAHFSHPKKSDAASSIAGSSPLAPSFVETRDGVRKHRVGWDSEKHQFQAITHPMHGDSFQGRVERYLRQSFLPDHVTPDYYNYTRWRVLQRLISATVSVFGTRALLLALGLKTERVGLTATFNWIQKDAFGKFGRIMWASKMGRRFDSDAKRWRFRSSLLYAAGTGLEVLTYIFPAAFLLLATVANVLKQMSMLTSSATRNAMYKSFAGDSQNLGDITAKGEAQIAVVDLLGILLGIFLSKMIGTAQVGMAVAYIALSCVDVFAIYNEIRSVVFSSLNLERGAMVVQGFARQGPEGVPTPNQASQKERIFWNPASIDLGIFKTVSQTGCSLEELHEIREVFSGPVGQEKHFLCTWSSSRGASIVLHTAATHHDILRALLTWAYFQKTWAEGSAAEERREEGKKGGEGRRKHRRAWSAEEEKEEGQLQKRALIALTEAHRQAKEDESSFLEALGRKGWDMRHTVFGRIKQRTEW